MEDLKKLTDEELQDLIEKVDMELSFESYWAKDDDDPIHHANWVKSREELMASYQAELDCRKR